MSKKISTKNYNQKHLDMFQHPNPSDFELIKQFLKSDDIQPENLFVYPIRLCDNQIDRDNERFSERALESICSLAVGVVGIKNHDWDSNNAHSRIYKAEIEEVNGVRSVIGYAYTLVTDSTQELINNIKSGLLQEVSIGFSASDFKEAPDGSWIIVDVVEVFEWSFVAVPAQPMAGVVKNMKKEETDMELETRVKELEAEVNSKSLRVKELEDSLAEKDAKIAELQKSIIDGVLKSALNDIKKSFKFKSAKAEEIADSVIMDIIEITEEGEVANCDAAEQAIKEDYDFLYETDEDNSTKSADEEAPEGEAKESDEEAEDESKKKSLAYITDNIIKKSKMDFTYIPDKNK